MKRSFYGFIWGLCLILLPFISSTVFSSSLSPSMQVHAQGESPSITVTPTPSAANDEWVEDKTVTFLGNTVSRAKNFMDFQLTNYKWNYQDAPLVSDWIAVRNIVYALAILAVVVTGFILVLNGGKSFHLLTFTKDFIIALFLVTFSLAFVRIIYQLTDVFLVFFNRTAKTSTGIITGNDIVSIASMSAGFRGFRKSGSGYDESVFISLLLVQLSAVTFYVIGFILAVRKIILWFFLISSPLYPVLVLFKPIRNSAKIWLMEFLRWLWYTPLFILFLAAVVAIYNSNILVFPFKFGGGGSVYPTAISILLGGPGQQLSLTNSLNTPDTFGQYIMGLVLLWVAILMPFILLQFLLDTLGKIDWESVGYINALQNRISSDFLKKPPTRPSPPAVPFSGGKARELTRDSFSAENKQYTRQSEKTVTDATSQYTTDRSSWQSDVYSQQGQISGSDMGYAGLPHTYQLESRPAQIKPEVLSRQTPRLISFPIPSMRDIAKFETVRLSRVAELSGEMDATEESLAKIANPKKSESAAEKEHYESLRGQLNEETTKGDVLAQHILYAASVIDKPRETEEGGVEAPGEVEPTEIVMLPKVNQIQTVSYDDYDAIKELWLENYQEIDVPESYPSRRSWIEEDAKMISDTITRLLSPDPKVAAEGLASVTSILPFLLIGGFSQDEVVAYLKAKLAANKKALEEMTKKEALTEIVASRGAKKKVVGQLHAEKDKQEEKN